jgi:hypothetical protein
MTLSTSGIKTTSSTQPVGLLLTDDSLSSSSASTIESEEVSTPTKQFVFWNMKPKTSYPQLVLPELDLVTDDGSNSSSDTEENSVQREKYSSKVDEDVAVFMLLAEKLSVTSLVHLLQGHVRSQQYFTWDCDTLTALQREKEQRARLRKASASLKNTHENPNKKRCKSFRFATIRNGDVRTIVHDIDPIAIEYRNAVWWNAEEMMNFRTNAIETVQHYRKHRKRFIDAVESIVVNAGTSSTATNNGNNTDPQKNEDGNKTTTSTKKQSAKLSPTVEAAVKVLTMDSYARGLETHICTLLSRTRTEMIEAILEEQSECRKCQDSYSVSAEALRGQSLAYSTASTQFAIALGHVDYIEALKAVMSVWTPEI